MQRVKPQGDSPVTSHKELEKSSLEPQKIDYVTSAAKAALGVVPFAGSLLAELAGTVIPNQRINRIVKFAEILEKRLAQLEQDFVKSQLQEETFSDLVEEGLRQASRSLSDERREYIASLISSSLSSEDIEYQESKHLLRVLSEINDIEVIWLRFYLVPTMGGDKKFRDKHKDILEPVPATLGASQAVLDKSALQDSYKEHLTQLGLLEREYHTDMRTKQPEFDRMTGGLKIRGYRLTPLGRLLLREIGIADAAAEELR